MSVLYPAPVGVSAKSIGTEISMALRELAAPWPRGEKFQLAIDRAARAAGLPFWRTFNLWYGKARRIDAFEREAILSALARKKEEETANEFARLRLQIERLEAMAAASAPHFTRVRSTPVRHQGF